MRSEPAETPARYMQKCQALQKDYSEQKSELAHDIGLITSKLLTPAQGAHHQTALLHKTLKHRENMKLDYERYLSRAEHARKKEVRSAKDEGMLSQHEANLAQAQIDYQTADDHIRQTFPSVSSAALQLLPPLLVIQVELQTTLLGQLYTVLDSYTRAFGLPNPAPSDTEIVRTWNSEFTALRLELESEIQLVARGKAVHLAMELPAEKQQTYTGLALRNKVTQIRDKKAPPPRPPSTMSSTARLSSQPTTLAITQGEPEEEAPPPRPPRPGGRGGGGPPIPSPTLNLASKPHVSPSTSRFTTSRPSELRPPPPYTPHDPTPTTTPSSASHTPAFTLSGSTPSRSDYFPQQKPTTSVNIALTAAAAAAAAAKKKKPPPPVPPKRVPSQAPDPRDYVTALFDFDAQNSGDLSFRAGDRIRVVKRTESVDDWWDGELEGREGAFPANYVEAG